MLCGQRFLNAGVVRETELVGNLDWLLHPLPSQADNREPRAGDDEQPEMAETGG